MIWWIILVLFGYLTVPLLQPIFAKRSIVNYRGQAIPTSLGLSFVFTSVLFMVAHHKKQEYATLYSILILFFALLGSIDDSLGSASKKGLRGHFGTGGLSTGALKAVGGIIISLVVGSLLARGWFDLLINGMTIALAANFLNLLDLRPGRAAKAFLVLGLPLLLFRSKFLQPLWWLMGALVGYLPWDLREMVMMGDAGSNPLGAALGLAAAIIFPVGAKVVLVVILLALNLLSEKISFSKIIESNRFLQFLDRLGR